MPGENQADAVTNPERHWNHMDPDAQPPRDEVIGVGRMVQEARARLGLGTSREAVLADLLGRGLHVTAEQVGQFWGAG